MSELSLIDALLYEADGVSAVEGDIATERLERVLARIRRASLEDRARVLEQVTTLHRQAEFDLARAVSREIEATERVREWKQRAAESKGELAEQANERLEQARAAADAIAEEAAEYGATVRRLEDVRAWISAIDRGG